MAAIIIFALNAVAQSVPPLINYQGRLTDQTGSPLAAGVYALQFRLWDSPTATNGIDLIWGQQQNVTVQANGVFNVILGSPGGTSLIGPIPQVNNLAYAFNGSNCFLGVTVAISNTVPILNQIEIFPRQQLLSVPYALFAAIAGTAGIATNAILAGSVAAGSITTASLAPSSVTFSNLATRTVGTTAPMGGIAISASCGASSTVTNLTVTLSTTGRPVFVGLIPDGSAKAAYLGYGSPDTTRMSLTISLLRDGTVISQALQEFQSGAINPYNMEPVGMVNTVDLAPAGTHNYTVQISNLTANVGLFYSKLVAYEL